MPLPTPIPTPRKPTLLAYFDWADVTAQTDFVARAKALHDAAAWGCTEFFIRCYGGLIGGAIHFDAWWRNGLDKTNFLDALSPFAGKLILYGGFGAPDVLAGLEQFGAYNYTDRVAYPARVLNAAMYFDASAGVMPNTVQWAMLSGLKKTGRPIGVESWPAANSAVVNENWCITEQQRQDWQPAIASGAPNFAWAQPLAKLPGRRISLFTAPPAQFASGAPGDLSFNPHLWYQQCLPMAMGSGFDVALSVQEFINNGITRASLGV